MRERASLEERLRRLSMDLWKELGQRLSDVRLIGLPLDHARRLPGTLNMLTHTHDGKVLVMRLDLEGLECSAGSACASGSLEPSHVLLALGHVAEEARAGLRVSLGRSSTWSDVRKAVDILGRTLERYERKARRAQWFVNSRRTKRRAEIDRRLSASRECAPRSWIEESPSAAVPSPSPACFPAPPPSPARSTHDGCPFGLPTVETTDELVLRSRSSNT